MTYVITLESPDSAVATATVDGQPELCRDVVSRQRGPRASVANWFDWILTADAASRRDSSTGAISLDSSIQQLLEDLDQDMWYETDDREHLANFACLDEARAWLNTALAETTVEAEVFEVRPLTRGQYPPGPLMWQGCPRLATRQWHPDGDGPGLNQVEGNVAPTHPGADIFDAWFQPARWTHRGGMTRRESPWIELRMSGNQFVGFQAHGFVPWDVLQTWATLSTRDGVARAPWWGLRIIRSDMCMVFPSKLVQLTVATWNDGSDVIIAPRGTQHELAWDGHYIGFRRQWGRYLDPNVELSDGEVAELVRLAESAAGGVGR